MKTKTQDRLKSAAILVLAAACTLLLWFSWPPQGPVAQFESEPTRSGPTINAPENYGHYQHDDARKSEMSMSKTQRRGIQQ